ncbi:MAG TPA: hypothetical protein VGG64_00940 [Pirellulales bacterium]|jgi:hypothetical protein
MNRFFNAVQCLAAAALLCASAATAEPPHNKTDSAWVRPRLVGTASDSGGFSLDKSKLRALFPEFEWTADQLAYLDEHLKLGDSRAAIVASVKPLVVSAYSDELDAVILVQFPDELVSQYALDVGDQLIASWTYPRSAQPPADIVQGDRNLKRHNNGAPLIADFFSDSVDKIKKRKQGVSQAEWQRVRKLTRVALIWADGKYRSSFPLNAGRPPQFLDESSVE